MSYIGSATRRVFGVSSLQVTRDTTSAGKNSQLVPEVLTVAAVCRKTKGPLGRGSGQWSLHIQNPAASGATSTLTVWYSNMPEPDETNDAHWVA